MPDFKTFQQSLNGSVPPEKISLALQALWWDAKGNWEQAHKIAQDISGTEGAWVHAYLHRKEGDHWNAGYWYSLPQRIIIGKRMGTDRSKPSCTIISRREIKNIFFGG